MSMDVMASLDEMQQGLDWVHWLLRSLRQRCAGIVLPEASCAADLFSRWQHLAKERFRGGMGQSLLEVMRKAADHRRVEWGPLESRWVALLSSEEAERSAKAGHWLLKSVKGARHAASLTNLAGRVMSGELVGHIGIVWPVVASTFQLPEVAMLSEYLRLEYQCAARLLPEVPLDAGGNEIVASVSRVIGEMPSGHTDVVGRC
ncbi:MAG: hypothetical protein JNJ83_10745 [Verrucomicrobiaceae bacterium]|nr:hypothetical protein [Verrucomicrobiaceae bacterium]